LGKKAHHEEKLPGEETANSGLMPLRKRAAKTKREKKLKKRTSSSAAWGKKMQAYGGKHSGDLGGRKGSPWYGTGSQLKGLKKPSCQLRVFEKTISVRRALKRNDRPPPRGDAIQGATVRRRRGRRRRKETSWALESNFAKPRQV